MVSDLWYMALLVVWYSILSAITITKIGKSKKQTFTYNIVARKALRCNLKMSSSLFH